MTTWTDELREQAIELYTEQNPTPENSMEVVANVADELGFSPNSVRMILSRAKVYITKTPAKAKASGGAGKRTNKAEAIEALRAAITESGAEVDEDIVSKLTGKAAAYFASVIAS